MGLQLVRMLPLFILFMPNQALMGDAYGKNHTHPTNKRVQSCHLPDPAQRIILLKTVLA
jgi:hypothetical protein